MTTTTNTAKNNGYAEHGHSTFPVNDKLSLKKRLVTNSQSTSSLSMAAKGKMIVVDSKQEPSSLNSHRR